MNMNIKYIFLILLFPLLTACNSLSQTVPPAELVLQNGTIYTAVPDKPTVQAVAIRDGKYQALGDQQTVTAYIGSDTEVIDLAGNMAMPGINDTHIHPVMAGQMALFECSFGFTASPDEIAQTLSECAQDQPDATWIRGGQWGSNFFELHALESPRGFLDAISDTHAIFLRDDSGHNAWVNSKALALAGIGASTENPQGGTIVRDADGEANGLLLETAIMLVEKIITPFTAEQNLAAAAHATRVMNAFGITGFKAAGYTEAMPASLHALDQRGDLHAHAAICLVTPYGKRQGPLDYQLLDKQRSEFASNNVHTNFVKLFMDGVPTPARTAAMIHPYVADELHGADYRGDMHLTAEQLTTDLIELDKRGFTVKIHTAGDGAVRVALDAIAAAREANGNSGLQHELAHAGYIDPMDIPRFKALGVAADFSPYLWHPSPIMDAVISAVGEQRGPQYWPTKSLLQADASVIAGSDWPAAVPSADPWVGLEALVTRRHPKGQAPGSLWPEEAVSLQQALQIYTLAGARALKLQDLTGSIEVGKSADLIVLDRNLLAIPIEDVSETQVLRTYFRGKLVHSVE